MSALSTCNDKKIDLNSHYDKLPRLFKVKVRKVGTSLGVLIPRDLVKEQKIKEGEEVEVGILKRRKVGEVLKLFGTAKGTEPFVRDREDRLDRY